MKVTQDNHDPQVAIEWYNRLTRQQRAYWHWVADSAKPVDAYIAYSNGMGVTDGDIQETVGQLAS